MHARYQLDTLFARIKDPLSSESTLESELEDILEMSCNRLVQICTRFCCQSLKCFDPSRWSLLVMIEFLRHLTSGVMTGLQVGTLRFI